MTEYVLSVMKELNFDNDAITTLYNDILKIYSISEAKNEFEYAINEYEKDMCCDHKMILSKADAAAELSGVHKYSAELLIYLCLSKHLKELYKRNNISLDIWHDSMLDLKWKVLECKAVKGIWGSFVAHWFKGFFILNRFALGRLQFETIEANFDYSSGKKSIKPGDKVINVHIPRTLTPLYPESLDNSYALATKFFKDKINNADMAFVCSTWLFFPPFIELYSEKSNLYRFAKMYDIISVKYDDDGNYPDAWRLFDMDFTGSVDDYPEDTSLRKAVKQYMKQGNKTGSAKGIFFAKTE